MNRLFGTSKGGKNAAPAASLDDAQRNIDGRVEVVDAKIAKLDQELMKYKEQMKKMKEGPAKNGVKQRALRVLKQKRQYEQQREMMSQQSFNMEQANFAAQTMRDTVVTVSAMKSATKELKQTYAKMSITEIEDVQDDMADLMDTTNEIQEIMGRSYGLPEDVDEADLEAELEGLEDDMTIGESESTPSYLADAMSAPAVPTGQMEGGEVDEFGLPVAAAPQAAQ